MKKNKLWLLSAGALALVPASVVSCQNDKKVEEPKQKNETTEQKITRLLGELTTLQPEERIKVATQLGLDDSQMAKLLESFVYQAGAASAVAWYMKSAENRLQAEQAYKLATIAFDNIKAKHADSDHLDYTALQQDTGIVNDPAAGKYVPVVFMDIDETVFVNEYMEAYMLKGWKNGDWIEKDKDAVDAKGNRRAVPGAIDFINHVFKNGGIVMFNSGIRQQEASIEGIKKNLIAAGVEAKYVHDWMFWCSGVQPVLSNENGTVRYDKTPWRTAINKFKTFSKDEEGEKASLKHQKVTFKNERMNAVSDNPDGWDFAEAQNGQGGHHVKTRVIMRIGDDFNDFYDEAYKNLKSNDKNVEFAEQEKVKKLFTNIDGAQGIKVTVNYTTEGDKKIPEVIITDLDWNQFNLQVPGNAMYGGWNRGLGYGSFTKLWKEIENIVENSLDNKEDTPRYTPTTTPAQPTTPTTTTTGA
ncbi:HAD family acid phosphatase [Mycoplasma sp. HS2188]|uniref:HAD family acid phosphatase n=1 Tax=Mycoplasma sp. HS2188 TaxID=2976765 RepID=UPI0021A9B729|nr:HAD family acid phosphatase [Mycoplasma sp. HS2188]MCT4469572.1 hypothetical protein [Mycoplasma sp. HS2188]